MWFLTLLNQVDYSSLSNKRAANLIIFWKFPARTVLFFLYFIILQYPFHYRLMELCYLWSLMTNFIIENSLGPSYKYLDF